MANNVKVGLVSDLHLESSNCDLNVAGIDVLVVPGDVLAGEQSMTSLTSIDMLLRKCPDPDIPVVFVPGNHEYEGQSLGGTIVKLKERAEGTHVHVLHNDVWLFRGVRFLGTTLWTDFNIVGEEYRNEAMCSMKTLVHDFSRILADEPRRTGGNPFITPERLVQEHQQARAWLEFQLRRHRHPDGPTVVLTHQAPSARSILPRFEGSLLNAYFASDLEDLVQEATLWCHGHMHDSLDYRIGDDPGLGRVLCNPRGSSRMFNLAQNQAFLNPLVVNLTV